MKIYAIDPERFLKIIIVVLIFEVLRVLAGFVLGRERGLQRLAEQKLEVQVDMAKIKSEQVEFVKKTKLERKVITIEKEIEKIKSDYMSNAPKWKRLFRGIRVVVFAVAAFYFTAAPLIMLDKVLFWPLSIMISPFASSCSVVLTSWSVLPISSFAFRHLLRAITPLLTVKRFP